MAKFAILVPPFHGHINPTLSVGAALIYRGHEVCWVCIDKQLKERLPTGGKLHLVGNEGNERYLTLTFQKDVYGLQSVFFVIEEVIIPINRYMFNGIGDFLGTFNPDLVINDYYLFAGAVAAANRDIPCVTSFAVPAAVKLQEDWPKFHEWESKKVVELQKEWGLIEEASIACSDLMALLFTSEEFFGKMKLPDHYKFVAPVFHHSVYPTKFDWEKFHRKDAVPRILVSIGTTFNPEHKREFFSKVVTAFDKESVAIVLACPETLFEEWPANFQVYDYIPQTEIMPHLDAVICHGGNNTVCEALAYGLPQVVIPIAYDQFFTAGCVTRTGCGIRLDFTKFKPEELKNAARKILDNRDYKDAAKCIQASFEATGSTKQAVELLEGLLQQVMQKGNSPSEENGH